MLLMHGLSYGPALTRNTKERASVCQSDQVGLRPPRVTSHPILTRTIFSYMPFIPNCRAELQQVRLLVRFSLKRLRFSLCTHTYVLLYSDTLRCPGDNSIKLGRTDASRQNSTTTNARNMSYRYTGVMLYQALCGVQRQL